MPTRRVLTAIAAAISALLLPLTGAAEIRARDATDHEVVLDAPAKRVISLAPHLTENLFAIGAGERIVGAVSFSDYPEAAQNIPRVGDSSRVDLERILAMKPDLVVGWRSGNDLAQLTRLRDLGIPVFVSESRTFDDIAVEIEAFGDLTGRENVAAEVAGTLRTGIASLTAQYHDAEPVRVFYQVWDQPLMTVNDDHLIAHAIDVCGGVNVFGEVDALVPRVDVESVLAADPHAIVAGGRGEDRADWLEAWREWPSLQAVRNDQLIFIPPSLLQRHTARSLEGTTLLCEALAETREINP